MKRAFLTLALSLSLLTPAIAAVEIDENEYYGQPYEPTYSSTVADTYIGKPLQLIGALLGTATYLVGIPFSAASGSMEETHATLVQGPWDALRRCTGCTTAYDNDMRLHQDPKGQARYVIGQPSEVIITTSGELDANAP